VATVHLRAGHVQPVWAGHPWVFAQAVADVKGAPGAGDVVKVIDPEGKFLGSGFWSPKSAVPVRILCRTEGQALDDAWLGHQIERAALWRRDLLGLPGERTTGFRLVNAEGDDLAGLIVDVFDRVAVVQFLTYGMKLREGTILGHIARVTGVESVIEVSPGKGSKAEGLEEATRVVRGPEPESLRFREAGFEFEIPRSLQQKTGFYFDQRDNRTLVEEFAQGRRVLDAFSYLGSFSLAAARGGATEVLGLDRSVAAVTSAAAIAERNGLGGKVRFGRADLKKELPALAQQKERFGLVVIDPPKLAPTNRHLSAGRRAYRRLNANAMRLVEPGGILVTCSCSGALRPSAFMRVIGTAARDADRRVTLLRLGEQGADHPSPVAFSEGRYLKAAFLRVD